MKYPWRAGALDAWLPGVRSRSRASSSVTVELPGRLSLKAELHQKENVGSWFYLGRRTVTFLRSPHQCARVITVSTSQFPRDIPMSVYASEAIHEEIEAGLGKTVSCWQSLPSQECPIPGKLLCCGNQRPTEWEQTVRGISHYI